MRSDRRVPVESVEKLIGMEARQAIQAGEMVYADQVQAPLLVKRGEESRSSSQGGGIRVRTTARVMQDGSHGRVGAGRDRSTTKDSYDARVTGSRRSGAYLRTARADRRASRNWSEQIRPGGVS